MQIMWKYNVNIKSVCSISKNVRSIHCNYRKSISLSIWYFEKISPQLIKFELRYWLSKQIRFFCNLISAYSASDLFTETKLQIHIWISKQKPLRLTSSCERGYRRWPALCIRLNPATAGYQPGDYRPDPVLQSFRLDLFTLGIPRVFFRRSSYKCFDIGWFICWWLVILFEKVVLLWLKRFRSK